MGLGLLFSFGTASLGHSGIRDLGQTGDHYHLTTVTKYLCVRYHAGNFRGGRYEHDMDSLCKKLQNRTSAMREECTNCNGYIGEELGRRGGLLRGDDI